MIIKESKPIERSFTLTVSAVELRDIAQGLWELANRFPHTYHQYRINIDSINAILKQT